MTCSRRFSRNSASNQVTNLRGRENLQSIAFSPPPVCYDTFDLFSRKSVRPPKEVGRYLKKPAEKAAEAAHHAGNPGGRVHSGSGSVPGYCRNVFRQLFRLFLCPIPGHQSDRGAHHCQRPEQSGVQNRLDRAHFAVPGVRRAVLSAAGRQPHGPMEPAEDAIGTKADGQQPAEQRPLDPAGQDPGSLRRRTDALCAEIRLLSPL